MLASSCCSPQHRPIRRSGTRSADELGVDDLDVGLEPQWCDSLCQQGMFSIVQWRSINPTLAILQIPEKWLPGIFDNWGSSHQVLHVLVLLGAGAYLIGLARAVRGIP